MICIQIKSVAFNTEPVLGGISLSVETGETLAILGASGIGKTTLLRAIAGLTRGVDGVIRCSGRLAMVFQEPTLLPWRSVVDNITLCTDTSQAEAMAFLEAADILPLARQFPGQLSLGQKRRLALARALAAKPDCLLLDEPFASLDPQTTSAMVHLTERLLNDRPIACLMVTHSVKEAIALANRAVVLAGCPAVIRQEILIRSDTDPIENENAQTRLQQAIGIQDSPGKEKG